MRMTRVALPSCLLPVVLSLASLSASAAPVAYVDNEVRDRLQEGGTARVIIQMGDASQPDIWAASWQKRLPAIRALRARVLAAAPKLQVRRSFSILPFVAATVDAATLDQVTRLPEVEGVFPDRKLKAVLNTSGPLAGQPQAEAVGDTGAGVGVAVLDTGIDYKHPAFNPPTAKFFGDVKPGFWAWRNIGAVAERGIASGYKDGNYHPEGTITRDQMAVFVARAVAGSDAGVPTPPPGTQSFYDVPPTYWAYKYIEYVKSQNIAGGYKDGGYHPTLGVTRAQMAVFLARATSAPAERPDLPSYAPPTTPTFTDVPTTYWAYKFIEYVVAQSVATGFPDHTYRPEALVTRVQMSVLVSRGFHLTWGGRVIGGVDLLVANADPRYLDPMDDYFHGTMVAGVAASMDPVYRGIAPGANLIGVKVLDSTGSGYSSTVIAGIEWCVQNKDAYGIKVINLSLGDGMAWTSHEACDAQPEAIAIQDAVTAGIFVAVASGNESYTNGISLPACASAAASVGATKDGDTSPPPGATPVDGVASYSDRGELMTMFAPGTWITAPQASVAGGGFATYEGTSFASPHVAGAAAVLAGMGVTDPQAIRDRLTQTGVQIVDSTTLVASPRVSVVKAINPSTTGPDLVVTAVSSTSTTAFTGDPVTLSLAVRNQGTTVAAACQAIIVLSANSTISRQDPVLAIVSVPALGPGASQTFSPTTGTVPAIPGGSYYLGAYVDSAYTVPELNEANNALRGTGFTVNVPSASLVSATIPATMQAGKSYTLSVVMRNDGTTNWTPGTYALTAVGPEGTTRWGTTHVAVPGTITPGAKATFSFSVTAPSTPGTYPCQWCMKKADQCFGEVATGGAKVLMFDDAKYGQDCPAVSGNRVAFMDYKSGKYRDDGIPAISVKDVKANTFTTLPDDIPNLINSSTGAPDPPFTNLDISYHYFPSISGSWVTWMADDIPDTPDDPDHASVWYFQILGYNLATPNVLPRRVTLQNADGWYPCVDGHLVVWEDYRNDADGLPDAQDFTLDNPDIYLADLSDTTDSKNKRVAFYPICTAPGPQFAPRISGNLVVWEDWRDGMQGDIYCYDLSVDSDGDGVPNWKDSDRPNPDPAERRLTDTPWLEGFPDVSGRTVVWLDYGRYTGPGGPVDIIAENVDTSVQIPVVADPPAYRQQVRIDGTQLVWEDWRTGEPDVYWSDLATPEAAARVGGAGYEGLPDISGPRLAYTKYRSQVTINNQPVDVYNVWTRKLLPYVQVQ